MEFGHIYFWCDSIHIDKKIYKDQPIDVYL